MQEKDLYKILGVSKTASQDEIKSAYKKLVMKYHPDRNPDNPEAEDRFKEVAVAYEALGDPEKRKLYDEFGMAALRAGFDAEKARAYRWGGPGGGFSGGGGVEFDIGSLFEQFFGGGAGRAGNNPFGSMFGDFGGASFGGAGARGAQRPAQGGDIEAEIDLDFLEAIRGTTRELRHPSGNGTIKVNIPPGIREGGRIRLRGKGQAGRFGGSAGDLFLIPKIRKHPIFSREEDDIILELPITLKEAYLGTQVDIPTPEGGTVHLKIPAGSQTGQKLRLRGKGAPKGKSGNAGDLYIVLKVILPKKEDPRLKELVEEMEGFYEGDPREELKSFTQA
ncbi:MAG: J domain-containing protein [Myxococcales bacterium]|nr:J domain-containing protein [Myxococcales bacterium]